MAPTIKKPGNSQNTNENEPPNLHEVPVVHAVENATAKPCLTSDQERWVRIEISLLEKSKQRAAHSTHEEDTEPSNTQQDELTTTMAKLKAAKKKAKAQLNA